MNSTLCIRILSASLPHFKVRHIDSTTEALSVHQYLVAITASNLLTKIVIQARSSVFSNIKLAPSSWPDSHAFRKATTAHYRSIYYNSKHNLTVLGFILISSSLYVVI